MQIKFALEAQLRREEFVKRALLFEAELIKDIEPVQLSTDAREALARCNPQLPDVFLLLAPDVDSGADAETGHLWEIEVNPNAYTPAEVVEMWAKEFWAVRRQAEKQAQGES